MSSENTCEHSEWTDESTGDYLSLTEKSVDISLINRARDPGAGAVSTFLGYVELKTLVSHHSNNINNLVFLQLYLLTYFFY